MIADMAADKTVPPDDISEAAMVAAIPGFGLSKLVEYAQRLGQDPDPRSTLRESQQALLRFLAVRDSAAFLARTGLYVIEQSRSEARRVGKECVSTGRSRWSPDH